jgi:hypothetical protein
VRSAVDSICVCGRYKWEHKEKGRVNFLLVLSSSSSRVLICFHVHCAVPCMIKYTQDEMNSATDSICVCGRYKRDHTGKTSDGIVLFYS